MTLKDWIYGTGFDNPKVNGEWGPLHIITLVICIALLLFMLFGSLLLIPKFNDELPLYIIILGSPEITFLAHLDFRAINDKSTSAIIRVITGIIPVRSGISISCIVFNK